MCTFAHPTVQILGISRSIRIVLGWVILRSFMMSGQ
jgi:hypothetical protein